MIPSQCPTCRVDCVTLREVARIAPSRWWHRMLGARRVRRIVTGYMQQCPLCGSQFIVTEQGITPIGQQSAPPAVGEPERVRPPQKREPEPPWMSKPPV
jgi:hypothetical protein